MNAGLSNDECKKGEIKATVGKFILRKNYQKNLDYVNKQRLYTTKKITEENFEDKPQQEWKRVLSTSNLKLSSKIGLEKRFINCEKKNMTSSNKLKTNFPKNSTKGNQDISFDSCYIPRQVSARVLSINKNKLIPNSSVQNEKFIDRKFSKYTKLDNIIIESDSNIFIEPKVNKNKPKRIKQENNHATQNSKKKNSYNNNLPTRVISNRVTENSESHDSIMKLYKDRNNNSSYNLLKNVKQNSSFRRDTSESKNSKIKQAVAKTKLNFHKTINSYDKIPNTATNFYTSKNKFNNYHYQQDDTNDSYRDNRSKKNYTFICKLNSKKISDISESFKNKIVNNSNEKNIASTKVCNIRAMRKDQTCFTPIEELKNDNYKKRSISVSKPNDDLFCKLNSSLSTAETSNIFRGRIEDYIIGKELGKGAYAIVNSCIHKPTNKKLAVKIYNKIKLNDIHKRNTVKREIEVLKKIEHQNIVKLHEVIDTLKQVIILNIRHI